MNPPATTPPSWLPFAILGAFLVVFPLFWCGVVWLIAQISGWPRLAQRYAAGNRPLAGERAGGVRGMIGGASYKGTLTLHFNAEGFFIEVMPIFKIGHPRLFIPWSEITGWQPVQLFWWKSARLSVGNPVLGTITLPLDLVQKHLPPA